MTGLVYFYFILHENSISKQCRPDQMPHSAASELGLHYLHMSQKQISSLKMVNA